MLGWVWGGPSTCKMETKPCWFLSTREGESREEAEPGLTYGGSLMECAGSESTRQHKRSVGCSVLGLGVEMPCLKRGDEQTKRGTGERYNRS